MANYCCATRTNYFHVVDEDQFRDLMSSVESDDKISVWENLEADGTTTFGFGCFGAIQGLNDEDDELDDESYDRFIRALMKCVAPGDAAIITESGNEKLRYVVGIATVVTAKSFSAVDLQAEACKKARRLLKNACWETKSFE